MLNYKHSKTQVGVFRRILSIRNKGGDNTNCFYEMKSDTHIGYLSCNLYNDRDTPPKPSRRNSGIFQLSTLVYKGSVETTNYFNSELSSVSKLVAFIQICVVYYILRKLHTRFWHMKRACDFRVFLVLFLGDPLNRSQPLFNILMRI